MKKIIAYILSVAMICSSLPVMAAHNADVGEDFEYSYVDDIAYEADLYDTGVISYAFGDEYNLIKAFTTASLPETEIGGTGVKVSTKTSNYNNVAVMNSETKSGAGYYPYKDGLPENGYYLFMGGGGNSSMSAALTLPAEAEAGKYIAVTYAKPRSTNNGTMDRSAGNENIMKIGGVSVDVEATCEYDKWYTTTVKVSENTLELALSFGKWSSIAISEIKVLEAADMLELNAENEIKSVYITSLGTTVQYNARVYKSVTTPIDSSEITAKGDVDESAEIIYSVEGNGVSIDESGLLTVSPDAQPGIVTVKAAYEGTEKSLQLELMKVSDADGVTICGEELVNKGSKTEFKAIPTVSGAVIPERSTIWTIEGDSKGCSISDGALEVPENAESGNIVIKAELAVEDEQTTAGVSDTFTVTIKDDNKVSPYEVSGVFLKDGKINVSEADGVWGAAVKLKDNDGEKYNLVVKAEDKNGIENALSKTPLENLVNGVQEVKLSMDMSNAALLKAYITDENDIIVSDAVYKTEKGSYKNVPLVADWITGEKSGLGMGAGIISPKGAPYGVDPDTVDVSSLNVSYTYDENYPNPTSDNALWYKTGAFLASANGANNSIYARDGADWEQQALPIGNGYMGGMLFGLPDKDQIQINEETFWAAGYRGVQKEVASDSVNKEMGEGINGYMSVGNIFVDFDMPKGAKVNNYYRDLNLDESVAHVSYEYDGVKYSREYFASYPKEVLVLRYTADKANALNFSVNPVSMHPGDVTVNNGEITITGRLKDSEPYSSGGNAAWNQESDLEYCTKIKVMADDGTVTDGYNEVNISGSTGVTVIIAASTDYDANQFELKADGSVDMEKTPYKSLDGVKAAVDKTTTRIDNAAALTYEELKSEHIKDYKAQFDTVKFSLTDDGEVCDIPTNELQSSYKKAITTSKGSDGKTSVSYDETAYNNLNKHLEELHYNYARYMMISSSRSTTMPATLQGKWCQSVAEIWGSCYCININMEMNYWFAGGANLLDSGKALIGWFNSQIPAGRITAKNMYRVTPKSYTCENGEIKFEDSTDDKDDVFIMHTKQSILGTTDMTGSTNIQSPGNTAWLIYNLWDLYMTTGDKELLEKEIYPIMRKAANFYTQYLYTNMKKTTSDTEKYPDGYYYTTWKGRSPEQGPIQEGIKYDLQLVAGMYDYCIEAAKVLGCDEDKISAWNEIRNHLEIPVELGDDGQIKEWAQETAYNTDGSGNSLGDPVHRHISHLVGLYPGNLINRNTPELLEGAKVVLTNRGDDSTGWSCSNKFLLWARTLDGDKALELFRYQLAQKTYANLFDTHAPFQIDGNFGSAAGVMELLMQSQTGEIYILPALPKAWDKGEISGIKAKNGAEISIRWSENKADEFTVTPVRDGDITIGYEKENGTFKLNGEAVSFGSDGLYTIKDAKAGAVYTFTSAEDVTSPKINLTSEQVSVSGADGGILIIAGYDADGRVVKTEFIDGFYAELSGYENCKTIKAFLWDGAETMRPLCASKGVDLDK